MTTKDSKKLCFVVGPIGSEDSEPRIHADWLLEYIIQPAMQAFPDFVTKRADQIAVPGMIDAQIINALLTAELVIADLSTLNPNAFYEIGIRHMAQKPIIHMQLADEQTPFDVNLYRAIKYSRLRTRDVATARAALSEQLSAVLANDYQVDNPITRTRGTVKLQEEATSSQRVLMEQIKSLDARLATMERGTDRTIGGVVTQRYRVVATLDGYINPDLQRDIILEVKKVAPGAVVGETNDGELSVLYDSTSNGATRVAAKLSMLDHIAEVSAPRRVL